MLGPLKNIYFVTLSLYKAKENHDYSLPGILHGVGVGVGSELLHVRVREGALIRGRGLDQLTPPLLASLRINKLYSLLC
jgi:hypothetical protein